VGNRAFAFRRFNRPDDLRASGSGCFDCDPMKIDENFVRLAMTARKLRSQSCAIDGLYRGREHLIGEVSYSYVSSMAGQMWPEEAQIIDFIGEIRRRYGASNNDTMEP
jgi:hypothetical protein